MFLRRDGDTRDVSHTSMPSSLSEQAFRKLVRRTCEMHEVLRTPVYIFSFILKNEGFKTAPLIYTRPGKYPQFLSILKTP